MTIRSKRLPWLAAALFVVAASASAQTARVLVVGDSWAADSRNGAITYSLATGAPPAAGGVRTWM